MKSIAWMTTDNLASRPHDYEMTLASARSAAHAFLNPTDHRQQETRSQHRWFRTTIMKLKLYFNLHQYIPGQNLPSFCQQTAIHNHCYQNFWELVKPSQQKRPKRTKNWMHPQIHLPLKQLKLTNWIPTHQETSHYFQQSNQQTFCSRLM